MKRRMAWPAIVLISLAVWQVGRPVAGQSYLPFRPQRNISGLVSGYEAFYFNDVRRRAEIARQVDLNADMYWRWSGVGSYYPGAFEAWPMVPGNIWGWPAAVGPPRVSPTEFLPSPNTIPPDAVPSSAPSPEAAPGAAAISTGLTTRPKFTPAQESDEPRPRRLYSGPREF